MAHPVLKAARPALAAAVAGAALVACYDQPTDVGQVSPGAEIQASRNGTKSFSVAVQQFTDKAFASPVTLVPVPDGSGRLAVVDQTGQIWMLEEDGTPGAAPFLDVSSRMVPLRPGFDERGLLGLAFHPDYRRNGRLYVYYSAPAPMGATVDHIATISEFTASGGMANPASERVLLRVDEPQFNHNGGTLAFGPRDGYLYLSLGDGGNRDDEGAGHVEDWYADNAGGNGQDIEQNLLGNILRIDVDSRAPGKQYGIPRDNPFVGRTGLDEIYAYGFRNPYRFSFDMGGSHDLLVGDVGQELWEEVSLVDRGGNYGWNVKEGTHCFDAENPTVVPASCPDRDPVTNEKLIDPVIEYANSKQPGGIGRSVVAGHVYRGEEMEAFRGYYIFGDFSRGFAAPDGTLLISQPRGRSLWEFQELRVSNRPSGRIGHFIKGFGQDLEGEIYVLTTDRVGPTGTSGRVYRLVSPEGGDGPGHGRGGK